MSVLLAAALLAGNNPADDQSLQTRTETVCYSGGCVTFAPFPEKAVELHDSVKREPEIFISETNGSVAVSAFYPFGEVRYADYPADPSKCRSGQSYLSEEGFYYLMRPETGRIGNCRSLSLVHLSSLPAAQAALENLNIEIFLLREAVLSTENVVIAREVLARLGPADFK